MMQDISTGQESGLVGKEALLEILFPNEADRPTSRWLDVQCKKKAIPFIRLGRLIFFDPPKVREAIATRHTIQSRRQHVEVTA